MNKKTILFSALLVSAGFSLLIILGTWIRPIGEAMLYRYKGCRGDLFTASYINHFDLTQPCDADEKTSENLSSPGARIMIVGDSFFSSVGQGPSFVRMLAREFRAPVWNLPDFDEGPIPYLHANRDKMDAKPRLLIMGRVERNTIERFLTLVSEIPSTSAIPKRVTATIIESKPEPAKPSWLDRFYDKAWRFRLLHLGVEPERRDHVFLHNFLVHPIYTHIQTLRFMLTHRIDSDLVYERFSLSPRFLFYKPAVDFNRIAKAEETLDRMVDSVVRFQRVLKERFNTELILLTVPNKYSLYADLVDKDYHYDGFVPRLTWKLRKAGVSAPDLYSRYVTYRKEHPNEWLYHPTDTHWAMKAKELAIDEVKQAVATRVY